MFKVFLDTNIFLDHFLKRNSYSSHLLKLCEEGDVIGHASGASLYTIAYILEKNLSKKEARNILAEYILIIEVLPTTKERLSKAFLSDFDDMEDAFQYFTALDEGDIDYFLTNNLKDFKNALPKLPVLSPEHFLSKYLKKR